MRKADYAALAAILAAYVESDKEALAACPGNYSVQDRLNRTEAIAKRFADKASVSRDAFLLACGIYD